MPGNYVSLLDSERYVTTRKAVKNARWRIDNNAIGDRRFLPLIRRTPSIRAIEQTDWRGMIADTLQPFPPDLLTKPNACGLPGKAGNRERALATRQRGLTRRARDSLRRVSRVEQIPKEISGFALVFGVSPKRVLQRDAGNCTRGRARSPQTSRRASHLAINFCICSR